MATMYGVSIAAGVKYVQQTDATQGVTDSFRTFQAIPPDATYFAGHALSLGDLPDSNVTYTLVLLHFTALHYLGPNAWGTYGSVMNADMVTVMARSWWRTIAGVHEVIEGPELTLPTINGNIVEWTVECQLTIDPE